MAAGLKAAADRLVPVLRDRSAARVALIEEERRGFEERLRVHWGVPLDQYLILRLCLVEQGSEYNKRVRPDDVLTSALVGLHAKACRVAMEVHALLQGGYGAGALARCRTLHETAVIVTVLSEWHGPLPAKIPDLADRYSARAAVVAHKEALVYQQNAEAMGVTPITAEELAAISSRRAAVSRRFVKDTARKIARSDYGWVSGVAGNERPSFSDLEVAAGLSHLRSYYKWASHEVHADATGVRNNLVVRGKHKALMTAGLNAGLADPGQSALISLFQITATLLFGRGAGVTASEVVGMEAMQRMLDEACEAFAAAEHAVRDAEDRYQRGLREAGE